ncbi:hypothetical protein BDV12DRAFT_188727 [Aspergillus spectabilis]
MAAAGITPIFHPWKLHLPSEDPYPGQFEEPEPPILVQDINKSSPHEEWDIYEIYKAIFEGLWDDWNSNPPWQIWRDFENAREKVLEYHCQHPKKPPPHKSFTDAA